MTLFPNWFDGQKYNFENHLLHLQDKPNIRFLQVGVYTGDASIWLAENILTNPTSSLIDVDTWAGSDEPEHFRIDFEHVYEYYRRRLTPYKNVGWVRKTSDSFFSKVAEELFDFIYIDGDHTKEQVTKDANNAWRCLKPNGILAFDDYMWGQDVPEHLTPRPAIDDFLAKHKGTYNLLNKDYQVWIQKNAQL